jgi:hypothetical protein
VGGTSSIGRPHRARALQCAAPRQVKQGPSTRVAGVENTRRSLATGTSRRCRLQGLPSAQMGERPEKRARKGGLPSVDAPVAARLEAWLAALAARNRQGLATAVKLLSEDVTALPDWTRYQAMDETQRQTVHEASLLHTYLTASPGCSEVLAAAKSLHKLRMSNQYRSCVELLRLLLLHNRFFDTGRFSSKLVKKVLTTELKPIHKIFAALEAKQSLTALALLRAMAESSAGACRELVQVLNVSALLPLCKREVYRQEREAAFTSGHLDLPGGVTMLVVALLRTADAPLKEMLISTYAVVSECLKSVAMRSNEVVLELLGCLRTHVLGDRAVPRRAKTRFFSAALLAQLGQLLKRAPGTVLEEPLSEFVMHLVSDHREGICYPEGFWAAASSVGWSDSEAVSSSEAAPALAGSRNRHLLPLLLNFKPWKSSQQSELLLLVLRECPRLAPEYFARIKDCFYPDHQPLAEWIGVMYLLRVYSANPVAEPVPFLSEQRVTELAERLVPPCPSAKQWRKLLLDPRPLVRFVALDTLTLLLERCQRMGSNTPLKAAALSVLIRRLPAAEFLSMTVGGEEARGNQAITIGSLLRCIARFQAAFGEVAVTPPKISLEAALSSAWSCVPALQAFQAHDSAWFHQKENRFSVLVAHIVANAGKPELRAQVLSAVSGLLLRSELLAEFPDEVAAWLRQLRNSSEAEYFARQVTGCMERPVLVERWKALQLQRLHQGGGPSGVSALVSHYLHGLQARGEGVTSMHFAYFARVVRDAAVSAIGVASAFCALLEPYRDCDPLLASTHDYLSFLGGPLHARPSRPLMLGYTPPATAQDVLADFVVCKRGGSSADVEQALKSVAVEGILCDQATFYVQHVGLDSLGRVCSRLCFEVLSEGCTLGSLSETCSARWVSERSLLDAAFAHRSQASTRLLAHCLLAVRPTPDVAFEMLCEHLSLDLLVLARCVDWAQVDEGLLRRTLQRLCNVHDWATFRALLASVWPDVYTELPGWIERCWLAGSFDVSRFGRRILSVEPSQALIDTVARSLPSCEGAEAFLLLWHLAGLSFALAPGAISACCALRRSVAGRALLTVAGPEAWVEPAAIVGSSRLAIEDFAHFLPMVVTSKTAPARAGAWVDWLLGATCNVPAPWIARFLVLLGAADAGQGQRIERALGERSDLAREAQLVALSAGTAEAKLSLMLPLLRSGRAGELAWRVASACIVQLPHIANLGDAGMLVVAALIGAPDPVAFGLLRAEVVENAASNTGWIERAFHELLSSKLLDGASPDPELLQLLLAMLKRRPNLCSAPLFGRVMGLYGATCSARDMILYEFVELFQRKGFTLQSIGAVWGPMSAKFSLDPRAAFYEGQLLTDAMLLSSYAQFPVMRTFGERGVAAIDECLDPCFVLPYLLFALRSYAPNARRFVQSGALGYALLGCSCRHEELRKVAYSVIQLYLEQLALASFGWKPQIEFLLSAFRGCVTKPFQCVPAISCACLARFSVILCNPDHFLYAVVNDVLLRAPVFDLSSVPLFHEAFLNGDDAARRWFLQLLAQGVKRTLDFDLLRRFHVIDVMLSFYHHVADSQERSAILNTLLQMAQSAPEVAQKIEKQSGVLGWLCVCLDSPCDWGLIAQLALTLASGKRAVDTGPLCWTIGWKLLGLVSRPEHVRAALDLLHTSRGSCSDAQLLQLLQSHIVGGLEIARVLHVLICTDGRRSAAVLERALELFALSLSPAEQFLRWVALQVAAGGRRMLTPRSLALIRSRLLHAADAALRRGTAMLVVLLARELGIPCAGLGDDGAADDDELQASRILVMGDSVIDAALR